MPTLTRAVSVAGSIILWVCAAVGVLTCAVWVATAADWIKPLIVISGSMTPEINKGDLLISVPTAVSDVQPGDVATLFNEQTQMLVTHRVLSVEQSANSQEWEVVMKGDANPTTDPVPYTATDTVWTPYWQIPGVGDTVGRLSSPAVVIPAIVALLALLGISLMKDSPTSKPAKHTEVVDQSASRSAS